MNIKEKISNDLRVTLDSLFYIVKKLTINEVSSNLRFIIDKITEENPTGNLNENKKINLFRKSMCSFEELAEIIYLSYNDISWVDLTVLHSKNKKTILLATLVMVNKTDNYINYHCYIKHPMEIEEGIKFDLNK